MSSLKSEDSRAHVLATFEEGIAKLQACIDGPEGNDTILAWDNGLAVILHCGSYGVGAIWAASAFHADNGSFAYPVVQNGARETAKVRLRKDAAAESIASLRQSINLVKQMGA